MYQFVNRHRHQPHHHHQRHRTMLTQLKVFLQKLSARRVYDIPTNSKSSRVWKEFGTISMYSSLFDGCAQKSFVTEKTCSQLNLSSCRQERVKGFGANKHESIN